MSPLSAVEFESVSLAYRRPVNRGASMKEHVVHLVRGRTAYETVAAVREVTFRADPGQLLAVIGPNGAGKSTLLKLVARVLPPTEGRVVVRGRVSAMIELAAGLDLELTTSENVLLYGALLGRDPEEVARRVPAILEWAELEDFEHVPVRTFSSGMIARLGFSISVDAEPDVLVVDEVLAVGDEAFQRRSTERIEEMIHNGTAVILVSHALPLVESMAHRAIWMDKGSIRMEGDPREVVSGYRASAGAPPRPPPPG